MPPTEKHGRRHSSVITVALTRDDKVDDVTIRDDDLVVTKYRGTGPGGQKKNKTENCARVLHIPTGIVATSEVGRSFEINRAAAITKITEQINSRKRLESHTRTNQGRLEQITGEKDFTWCDWRDEVHNHKTNKKSSMSKVLKGRVDLV